MRTETDKSKSLETSLVLTTFMVILFIFTRNELLLFIAAGLGLTGIFIHPLAHLLAKGWFALAHGLNYIFSRLILGTIYFILLTPISFAYRILKNDRLQLSGNRESTWRKLDKYYHHSDLKNIW
jgi:hypothetical protein